MIASSLREGETMVDLLIAKDADVNIKSASRPTSVPSHKPLQPKNLMNSNPLNSDFNGQVRLPPPPPSLSLSIHV